METKQYYAILSALCAAGTMAFINAGIIPMACFTFFVTVLFGFYTIFAAIDEINPELQQQLKEEREALEKARKLKAKSEEIVMME